MKFSSADKVSGAMVLAVAVMVVASGVREDFLVLSAGTAYNSVIFKSDTTIMGTINAVKMDYLSGNTPNCNIRGIKDGGVGATMYPLFNSDNTGIKGTPPCYDGVNFGELFAMYNSITNSQLTGRYVSRDYNDGKIASAKLTFQDNAQSSVANTNCCMYGQDDNSLAIDASSVDCHGAKIINLGRGTLGAD